MSSTSLIKCPKGHKSLGSLCSVVNSLIVSLVGPTNQGTRLWTAKNLKGWLEQPFLCANISQIFVLKLIITNICCRHFLTSFSKPAGIPTDSCENTAAEMGFKFRTQISMKSETDFKYFCLFRCAIIKSLFIVSFLSPH